MKALQVMSAKKKSIWSKIVDKNVDVAVVAGAVILGAAAQSQAALTLTGVTLNTADVESIMMLVIPALGTLWGFRKIVKTTNRS